MPRGNCATVDALISRLASTCVYFKRAKCKATRGNAKKTAKKSKKKQQNHNSALDAHLRKYTGQMQKKRHQRNGEKSINI